MKTLNQILEIVCEHTGADIEKVLYTKKRTRKYSTAKKIFIHMALAHTFSSMEDIMNFFSQTSLTNPYRHNKEVKNWRKHYDWFRIICDEIEYAIIK